MSWKHGIVRSQLPIMSVALGDRSYNPNPVGFETTIGKDTPALILTRDFFYFGNLDAFTDNFADVRNKFFVPHIDGEPQVAELISTMTRWHRQKLKTVQPLKTDVLVFLPSSEIPMPIVTQVIHWVKKSELYENVILASELL